MGARQGLEDSTFFGVAMVGLSTSEENVRSRLIRAMSSSCKRQEGVGGARKRRTEENRIFDVADFEGKKLLQKFEKFLFFAEKFHVK